MSEPIWEIGHRKEPPMNYHVMHQNLLTFKKIMDKYEVRHIWIFGGLLGLIREGDMISYDDDVEFACFFDDHRKMINVVKEMKQEGFYVPDRDGCPLHDHFFIKGGEKIELWWFTQIDGEYIYDQSIRYQTNWFDSPEEITFLGEKWLVPNNPEEFLTKTYGESWRIPNPKGRYIL